MPPADSEFKRHFSRALGAAPGRLHFAAHSHHLWPDVTLQAHQQAWDDAARLADHKWGVVDEELIPEAREHVARRMGLADPRSVVFGPNTHSFVMRLLSCLPVDRPLRVLTTDSEFHSFRRQLDRLVEAGRAEVARVEVGQPWSSSAERLAAAAAAGPTGGGGWDLIYFSQVFFDSAFALTDEQVAAVVDAVDDPGPFVVIDGYHGFMARPTELSAIQGRAFYMAGGYKYAMAGEGACWLHAPAGYGPRPADTGWFAMFDALEGAAGPGAVPYPAPDDASRFLGATLDPTPIHRFVAVQRWLEAEGLTVQVIHDHARALQARLLNQAGPWRELLLPPGGVQERGNFLVFRTPHAGAVRERLGERSLVVDHRDDRLRLGFGLYQDAADVDAAARILADEWPG